MKRTLIALIIIIIPLLISAQSNKVIIEGQIIGYKGTKPLNYSIKPYYGLGNNASIQPDSEGRFRIVHSLENTEYFTFYFSEGKLQHTCRLILQPGKQYSVISKGHDTSKERWWEQHYSPNIYQLIKSGDISNPYTVIDKGHNLYNLIDNGTSGWIFHDQWDLSKPDSLIPELRDRIQIQLLQFQQLLDNGSIDQNFFEIAKMNLEYTNAYRLGMSIRGSWEGPNRINDTVQLSKLAKVYPKIFEMYPVKGVRLENHFCFVRYVDLYMSYLDDCLFGEFIPGSKKDTIAVSNKLKSKDILLEDAYKVYHMNTVANHALNRGSNSRALLDNHLDSNPNLIDPDFSFLLYNIVVPMAEDYNKLVDSLSKTELPAGVLILDIDEPIRSLAHLQDIVGYKYLFIDLWGSWCGACKYQFQFQNSLKAFLVEHDITMVYVAKEYVSTKENWITCLKQYKLEGYHFLLNDSFYEDLVRHGAEVTKYPTYIIVNKKGEIVESEAIFPNQTKLLIQQLKLKLNL